MVGWALRWVLVWFGIAAVWAAVTKGGWLPPPGSAPPEIAISAAPRAPTEPPAAVNTLVYPADGRGHILLDAFVNGAPVRFLVDTVASLVVLTPADARAAGVSPDQLAFDARASTANGVVRMAPVTLREMRLGQLSVADVRAAVIEHLGVSLLGVSFLSRLRSYEMRDGRLTITW
jgi:clan AA aspartic protease (TIGR02281 family)